MAREKEGQDNSLMGTEPLLFKMDHTQLDKYCKNLQIFLFVTPMSAEPTPAPQVAVSCFPALVTATAGTDCSKGPPKSPPQTQLQSPRGREGP